MFFDGYIGAPPTCTVFSARACMPAIWAELVVAKPIASAAAAAVDNAVKRANFISISCYALVPSGRDCDRDTGRRRKTDAARCFTGA